MVLIPYCPDHLIEQYQDELFKVYELFEKETSQDIDLIIDNTKKNAEFWMDDYDPAAQESKKLGIFLDMIRSLGPPSDLLDKTRHDAAVVIQKHLRGWLFRKTQLWNPNCSVGQWDLNRKTRFCSLS